MARRTAPLPIPAGRGSTLDRRAAGILLHVTSLPGPHGSGDLGAEAYRFVDFLWRAGVRWWQMLPTTPIGPGYSPYCSTSAFAGNALLIDLRQLVSAGWLRPGELAPPPGFSDARVRFEQVIAFRGRLLRGAFFRWRAASGARDPEFISFCREQAHWLNDYALFVALKSAFRGRVWNKWPAPLRDRDSAALRALALELRDLIEFQRFQQFVFLQQWTALRAYAAQRGVGLIGDLPIFNAHDSADVWALRELYAIGRDGRATGLTGCPPDAFSDAGQFWGHPQYDWKAHERSGFKWWIARFRHLLAQFDAVRIDHFLGFDRVWWIPGNAKSARQGRYVPSPGDALFAAVKAALGKMNIIAEDLGTATPEAYALRDKYGFPGMRTLIAGFGSDEAGAQYHLPHTYVRNGVAYTGTHDNETLMGWVGRIRKDGGGGGRGGRSSRNTAATELNRVERYFGSSDGELHWRVIRALYMSVANLVVIPMQDVLGLGAKHRMNLPGTASGNWGWRLEAGMLTWATADRLGELGKSSGR